MTSKSETASGISYSSELGYLRLAVNEQEVAHQLICAEIENFKPASRDELIEKLTFNYRQAPNPESLKSFILSQADAYSSNPAMQAVVEFGNRYAVRKTLSVLTIHALCEGLINATLAIGLHHVGKSSLFKALEMCSLVDKWEVCPTAFVENYRLERSSHVFGDLNRLCAYRNATTHQKIQLRNNNGEIVTKGKMSGLSLDKISRNEISRFFSLAKDLQSNLIIQIEDKTLQFYFEELLT